jgi:hypothetical protein
MKFDFRVGIALAVVAVSASCSQTPQAPTAPSASAEPVTAATGVDGSTLKVSQPALVSPVEGERVNDRRPTLVWANATAKYGGIGVAYDIQVSSPTTVVYDMTVGETPDFGSHIIPFDLEYDTRYLWRVRARVANDFGPWSGWAEFLSPQRPVAVVPTGPGAFATCTAPMSPLGPGETRKPRPNDSAIVRAVAAAFPVALFNSCQDHGGTWEFMDRAVDALRAKDGRYGYNAKRGNMFDPSLDVVSYYYRADPNAFQGSDADYIFDIIGGHCGPTPVVVWVDVTDITYQAGSLGRTMYPRPGRQVTVTPCETAASTSK